MTQIESILSAERSGRTLFDYVQGLPTSGARAVLPFELDGELLLAVPQLARDIDGEPAYMNGGDSDLEMLIYRWDGTAFLPWQSLPLSGGEDVEFFRIGDRCFLAVASLRSGHGPYELDVDSVVYEWFVEFQRFPTFAAKQWRHFELEGRHFLGLAQGVVLDGVTARNPSKSQIFEWDGATFRPFQELSSAWGYNFTQFTIDDRITFATPTIMNRRSCCVGTVEPSCRSKPWMAAAVARSASSKPTDTPNVGNVSTTTSASPSRRYTTESSAVTGAFGEPVRKLACTTNRLPPRISVANSRPPGPLSTWCFAKLSPHH